MAAGATGLQPWLRDILRCPVCHGLLRDETAAGAPALVCEGIGPHEGRPASYRIEEGIPVLLPTDVA